MMRRNGPLILATALALVWGGAAAWAGGHNAGASAPASGIAVGAMVSPFQPMHVAGPDAGTRTCPVCKYGARPAVQIWFNNENMRDAAVLGRDLSRAVADNHAADLKGFLVFIRPTNEPAAKFADQLKQFAAKNKLADLGVMYVSSPAAAAVRSYHINTSSGVHNTVFVYRDRKVASKMVNLLADAKGTRELSSAIRGITVN